MRKHGCAAGLASSEPAISFVVTRDDRALYTRTGCWSISSFGSYLLFLRLGTIVLCRNTFRDRTQAEILASESAEERARPLWSS